MSQNKTSLFIVAKESGYKDYILRPLSARLLPETKPELEGKVDRSRLLDISGRQRKRQFEMAEKYGIKDVPTPAGGCLLTDPGFSKKLKDLLAENKCPSSEDMELLKSGRHVRLDGKNKIVIGRDKEDNANLVKIRNDKYVLFAPVGVRGPYCMVPRDAEESVMEKAAAICASYCSAEDGERILFKEKGKAAGIEMRSTHSKSKRPTQFIGQ